MHTLKGTVRKNHKTGFVFADINNDLGDWCSDFDSQSKIVKMAYGYARRIAVDALYAQGLVKNDVREHVFMIFKSLQMQTGQTVEFQEAAYAQAIEYIKGYIWQFTSSFAKSLSAYATAKVPQAMMADADLFADVIDFSYREQIQAQMESAELIDKSASQHILVNNPSFNQACEGIDKDVFDDLPIYHPGRDEAEKYAKENGKVVYQDSSGYFTANEGYVPPAEFKLEDDDIEF
ncbi:hypothetical protein N7414_30545 [Pseudomonas sp. GD04087]|uniref:hypothetical protein n=1 Tax=unclassified Pseudomonas TaxID=196821 RepID=UPI002447CAE8|nr:MULTISPECIES: hypothetical protein [unclassified Pseudomonas]MDH0293480.1 hypothetical protein [Pseudomonas sp. GD04087]MDH1053056.1 hypothetical protein [Pseudomonas sp. GD03903]